MEEIEQNLESFLIEQLNNLTIKKLTSISNSTKIDINNLLKLWNECALKIKEDFILTEIIEDTNINEVIKNKQVIIFDEDDFED